ncbi:hypothetical protein FF32_13200 [Halomonas campaniensis]|nr:hypothetical protein FF32_13200 [Halomonas campaniensis]
MSTGPKQSSADEISTEQRIRLEHRLGIRRILVDRLFIGVLVALVGFIASLAIEQFKATTVETRYFLEKRLEAGTAIRSALTDVTSEAIKQTIKPCTLSTQDRPSTEEMTASIEEIVDQLNDSALLFSEEYLLDANRIVNLFSGAAAEQSAINCESRYFFSDIADYLTHRTKTEVHGGGERWNGYEPLEIEKEDIDDTGVAKYYKRNMAAWSAARD